MMGTLKTEPPFFDGKNMSKPAGFRCRFSLKPIHLPKIWKSNYFVNYLGKLRFKVPPIFGGLYTPACCDIGRGLCEDGS
jgi:hypothetical protein